MSTDDSYNGWTNRETWAVALHINNDQGWQESVHEALRAAVQDNPDPENENTGVSRYEAGAVIRENVEETLTPERTPSFDPWTGHRTHMLTEGQYLAMCDIGSLWRVDWAELGASFLSDLAALAEHDTNA